MFELFNSFESKFKNDKVKYYYNIKHPKKKNNDIQFGQNNKNLDQSESTKWNIILTSKVNHKLCSVKQIKRINIGHAYFNGLINVYKSHDMPPYRFSASFIYIRACMRREWK